MHREAVDLLLKGLKCPGRLNLREEDALRGEDPEALTSKPQRGSPQACEGLSQHLALLCLDLAKEAQRDVPLLRRRPTQPVISCR